MPSKNKIVETARYLTTSIKGNNFVNSCCIYANTGCALVENQRTTLQGFCLLKVCVRLCFEKIFLFGPEKLY